MSDRRAAIAAHPQLEVVLALLGCHRDHHRDLGTHGIGRTQGLPESHPTRAMHRSCEELFDMVIADLRGEP